MTKVLIFDSGSLINLSMNGLLYILKSLKEKFDGKFLITNFVKYETVDKPIGIQRFELGALQIQALIDSKVLELPESMGINPEALKEETKNFTDMANHFLQARGKWINIVSDAEMSCLALSLELEKRNIENIIAIDERTTRVLCENPSNLERMMSEKLHEKLQLVADNFSIFSKYKFIRSTEIVFVAYKKGLIDLDGKKALEALLYATKFKGSSVSFEEIEEMKKL